MSIDIITAPPPPPTRHDHGRDDRPRRDDPTFLPSLHHLHRMRREEWRGMLTIRHEVMTMWDDCHVSREDGDDPAAIALLKEAGRPIIRTAEVASATYWRWMSLYHPLGTHFPHIQWGGHLKATPDGDGGAGYRAWKLHALTLR